MSLLLDDGDVRLYHGDALTVLRELPAESVHMCVTSPPFFGLRDYQTGRWEGGNPDCDHADKPTHLNLGFNERYGKSSGERHQEQSQERQFKSVCGKCGARRVDQQIGLEDTPEAWVASLVAVFREVRRVLRDDGTLWLEVGDSYNNRTKVRESSHQPSLNNFTDREWKKAAAAGAVRMTLPGCKEKDLIGAPWMLAFALRADGWWLRSDIVWARPNPMPESVTDRPTKSHSYVFLLAKQPRYFFDQEAVREGDDVYTRKAGGYNGREAPGGRFGKASRFSGSGGFGDSDVTTVGRNVRSVWTIPGGDIVVSGGALPAPPPDGASSGGAVPSVWNIATQPYPEAHFATFPEELARRCILAGTSERGCCPECGAPWIRQTDRESEPRPWTTKHFPDRNDGGNPASVHVNVTTTGWRLACVHDGHTPCVVLDPFVGSGTVPFVARKHGRHAIGIDLSASYLELAARRLQQLSLFA